MQKLEKYHFISFTWFSDFAITPETLPLFFSVQLIRLVFAIGQGFKLKPSEC